MKKTYLTKKQIKIPSKLILNNKIFNFKKKIQHNNQVEKYYPDNIYIIYLTKQAFGKTSGHI